VFDPRRGVLLDDPDIEAIFSIRQLTLMFSKIALPDSTPERGWDQRVNGRKVVHPARERAAMSEYIQCEHDVRRSDDLLDPSYLEEFVKMADMLFGEVFAKTDRDIQFARLQPKHGPGAVADKLTSNDKWNLHTWTRRLQPVLPAEEFLVPNPKETWDEERGTIDIIEPGSEIPVRVIAVPKTLKLQG